jgi:hypothetical protein
MTPGVETFVAISREFRPFLNRRSRMHEQSTSAQLGVLFEFARDRARAALKTDFGEFLAQVTPVVLTELIRINSPRGFA